ncbi:MAG: hypothetical protein JG777_2581 [Clostridia bacterium]|nr:hypothetical protein [Clostridia bacterium]
MIVTVVEVYVQEAHIEDFKKATIENHQASIQEPGNLRLPYMKPMNRKRQQQNIKKQLII